MTTKTYAAKSSAVRAAKKELGSEAKIDIDFKIESLSEKEWVWNKVEKESAKPLAKSSVANPCRRVWEIAEEMKGFSRKDILEACVQEGIAFYTARTQYQQWKTAVKNSQG